METVILCNGQFPSHHIPLNILNAASKVVCCDGAAVKLLDYGLEPYAIVGDLDSLPNHLHKKYSDIVYHNPDQETNDQTKAVEWCIERGYTDIVIIGGTGMREDHTLGNIALLGEYVERINVQMITDYGVFYPITKSTVFDCSPNLQVSLFALTPETEITTTGLQYNVHNRRFLSWYQGTLNQSVSTSFTVQFSSGKVIVFIEHKK